MANIQQKNLRDLALEFVQNLTALEEDILFGEVSLSREDSPKVAKNLKDIYSLMSETNEVVKSYLSVQFTSDR